MQQVCTCAAPTPFGAVPSQRQICHLKDLNKKAFFHFGVNTFTNAEWGEGTEDLRIFNPSECDVRQWVAGIHKAGFKLALLTAKHHDGFCLWQTQTSEHSIKNTPYKEGKGDIVREFADACRAYGLSCGIYLSPWDRNAPCWGSKEYNLYYNAQLTELLTNYGRIDEIWWDGAGSKETPYDWELWANTVRTLQPHAVIFGSFGATKYVECRWIGNEGGFAPDTHFPTIYPAALEIEHTPTLGAGVFGGERFIPAEVDVSIRPGWFYHPDQDDKVKSVPELVDLWFHSVGRGAMMLLNFPPDRRGLLPDADIQTATQANDIVRSTFAVNLAEAAAAVSGSVLHSAYHAGRLLDEKYDTFYAAAEDDLTPTIEIMLPQAVAFDTFAIGEKVEYGIRVKEFRVEVWVNNAWKTLAHKHSMGFHRAERFERVTSDRVRIAVLNAAAPPVLRTFGLYKLPDDYYDACKKESERLKNAVDLTKLETAKITEVPNGVQVAFGGIYPFNTVCFNGTGIWNYEIHAFDGSNFQCIYKGVKPSEYEVIKLPKTVQYAYQMRLLTDKADHAGLNIKIMEL